MSRKRVVILGSTGSIGENAVRVAKCLADRIEVVGLAARNQVERIAEQAAELHCRKVVTSEPGKLVKLKKFLPPGCVGEAGEAAMLEMVCMPEVDLILCAIVGSGGLLPVLHAVTAGKDVALASKEVLVMAGDLVMSAAAKSGSRIIPVDSEHSAIFQCLEGHNVKQVSKIILTASGGPFRNCTAEELKAVTYERALAHPTWDMGPKVTIDSASLMNKALEIIEAGYFFGLPPDKIDVLVHPQSVIHSMVEFVDGTLLAQLSAPDMRFPIQYALTWPERVDGIMKRLDFAAVGKLEFFRPNRQLFPSLDIAYRALSEGGTMPAVMNAANEVAVELFRKAELRFTDIWKIIETVMAAHRRVEAVSLEAVMTADAWARSEAMHSFFNLRQSGAL